MAAVPFRDGRAVDHQRALDRTVGPAAAGSPPPHWNGAEPLSVRRKSVVKTAAQIDGHASPARRAARIEPPVAIRAGNLSRREDGQPQGFARGLDSGGAPGPGRRRAVIWAAVFHHAFPAHGEGFCAIHDVAVAIRRLLADGAIERALVIDCDVHHGNGTAAIFEDDPAVFTISIHQMDNYPTEKPPSTIDVHLPDRTGMRKYLRLLKSATYGAGGVPAATCLLPGGADPYYQDQLGGLALTLEGLKQRDRLVMEAARRAGAPVAVVLAGGYAADVQDTVRISLQHGGGGAGSGGDGS